MISTSNMQTHEFSLQSKPTFPLPRSFTPNRFTGSHLAKVAAISIYIIVMFWTLATISTLQMPTGFLVFCGVVLLVGLAWFTSIILAPEEDLAEGWHRLSDSTPIPRGFSEPFSGYHLLGDGRFHKRQVCIARAFYGDRSIESKVIVMTIDLPKEARFSILGVSDLATTNPAIPVGEWAKAESKQKPKPSLAQRFTICCVPNDLVQPIVNRPAFWEDLETLTSGTTIEVWDGLLRFEQPVPFEDSEESIQLLRFLNDLADGLEEYYSPQKDASLT